MERYDSEYNLTLEDRKGRCPREFLNVFSPDRDETMGKAGEHLEWLKPQDQADLIVRYVSEIVEGPGEPAFPGGVNL